MLLEFKVANHKSLAREQSLSLVAHSHRDLREENTLPMPGKPQLRVLKTAAIYGPNGGGKSSLIEAAHLMQQMVLNSTFYDQLQSLPANPFRLEPELKASPTSLEAIFVFEGVRYRYGFSFTAQRIEAEWLSAWPKGREQVWFLRGATGEWYLGREFGERARTLQRATTPTALFLTTAAALNHPGAIKVRRWFAESLKLLVPAPGFWPTLQYTLSKSEAEPDFKLAVQSFLSMADVGVRGFSIGTISAAQEALEQAAANKRGISPSAKRVFTEHVASNGELVQFDLLNDESVGTKNLFGVAGPWVDTLRNGYTVLVDEILAPLHPLLIRQLVTLFHESQTGAQLILTTHDTNLLDPSLLRRDQVYFVEKDLKGESHLYSLLEYQPRKNEAREKGYLAGRYGAIPFIGEFRFPYGESVPTIVAEKAPRHAKRRTGADRLRRVKG
jgi:hypothetical protein